MHVDPVIHMSIYHCHNLEIEQDNNYFNANAYITFIDSLGNMGGVPLLKELKYSFIQSGNKLAWAKVTYL